MKEILGDAGERGSYSGLKFDAGGGKSVGVDQAVAVVVTMDNPKAAERVVTAIHRQWPDLAIYARARDREHAARLIAQGARYVVPEIMDASQQLGEMVLIDAGVPDEVARRIIEARRKAEQEAVDERPSV